MTMREKEEPMPVNHSLPRRAFIQTTALTAGALAASSALPLAAQGVRPNVLLIMTDDQGYGDLGFHSNPQIRTPHLDQLARESAVFERFYVCPVCAPTRACLLTGRYNYRTGVVDTFLGRAMMHGDEITMAEVFGNSGYQTGLFGKWHLGDNAPMRPSDQGFTESLIHRGGGIGQPSDPPGSAYADPTLFHNNTCVHHKGYCTDVFTDAAIQFIHKNKNTPFFAYLATNAPHTPLQIDPRYVKPYLDQGLDETTAKVYGMVENIDENMGRLLGHLKKAGLEDNTIVIFLTDNGPQQPRYVANLRGLKGSVYEGGIRVPCFVRWPRQIQAGTTIQPIAAHIDWLPTLIEACGLQQPSNPLDGRSLLPLLTQRATNWPDRTLFTQWHRGDVPEPFRDSAAFNQRYKLINGKELYDIQADPGETTDIAATHPQIVEELREHYEAWFSDVSATRGFAPPRIDLGSALENPVTLTRQDWRGPRAGWSKESLGYWEVNVRQAGAYHLSIQFEPMDTEATIHFKLGSTTASQVLAVGAMHCVFQSVALASGESRLETWLESATASRGVEQLVVSRL
ncbi:MAG: arylsulfatase [bacterium]|jgi:arylsulfatase A-like enzyme|nr:arylsulfatase [bacterium]